MITNTNNVVRYNTIAATPYEIPFTFWDDSEIQVIASNADGDSELLTLTDDYTITKINNVYHVTLVSPADLSDYTALTIARDVAAVQLKTLLNGTNINGPQIEQAFDKLTAMVQQILERFSRSILSPVSEAGSNLEVPLKEHRKNMLLGFNATGSALIPVLTTDIEQRLADALAAELSCISNAAATAADRAVVAADKATVAADKATVLTNKNATDIAKADAETAQSLAEAAQAAAETAEANAVAAKVLALAAQALSEDAAELSEAYAKGTFEGNPVASNHAGFEDNAMYYKNLALAAKTAAETAQAGAVTAKTAAETAQGLAEAAQLAAETAETNAETAESGAVVARTGAETAQAAAVAAQTAAETAETNAETAETNAETAQSLAEAAQAAAEAALASVMAMYAGASATAPATPIVGMLWFDTTASRMKTWDGSAWFISFNAASNVSYSNTTSGLLATDVQGAIDEVAADFQSLGLIVINNQICMTEE